MGERSIPHLRDIFGVPFDGIDRSPQSRRRLQVSPPEVTTCTTDPDSAVSVGSCSGDEDNYQAHKKKGNKGRSRGFEETTGCRTLTQRDVRHLERHLSMKKTIRKKIMRDLRQAFVEDPSEFQHTSLSPEQLREINLQNLRVNGSESDANFLEILRDGSRGGCNKDELDRDSGHGSPTREPVRCRNGSMDEIESTTAGTKQKSGGFWKRFTLKGRGASKR